MSSLLRDVPDAADLADVQPLHEPRDRALVRPQPELPVRLVHVRADLGQSRVGGDPSARRQPVGPLLDLGPGWRFNRLIKYYPARFSKAK